MHDEHFPFLSLPLELREVIYKEVLSDPSQSPHLLRVNRGIHCEAQKFLYQRPIIFRGQLELYRWLGPKSPCTLHHVQKVLLQLQDVDLTSLLAPIPTGHYPVRSRSFRTMELYEEELHNLAQAFQNLPNIKILTIRTLSGRQPHLYDNFLANILQMLGIHFPGLQDLRLEGNYHNQRLNFLQFLPKLIAFSFDGISASTLSETAAIFSSLNLTRLSLTSEPTLRTPTRGYHSITTGKSHSFDISVLRTCTHLSSLTLTEQTPYPCPATPFIHLIPTLLSTLHLHTSLTTLSLHLSHVPDEDTLDTLYAFLENSATLDTLELDWPRLDPAVLYILTNRLQSLWVRVGGMDTAAGVLSVVLESRMEGDVKGLRVVVLVRGEGEGVDRAEWVNGIGNGAIENDDTTLFAKAKAALRELGVEMAWHTERS